MRSGIREAKSRRTKKSERKQEKEGKEEECQGTSSRSVMAIGSTSRSADVLQTQNVTAIVTHHLVTRLAQCQQQWNVEERQERMMMDWPWW